LSSPAQTRRLLGLADQVRGSSARWLLERTTTMSRACCPPLAIATARERRQGRSWRRQSLPRRCRRGRPASGRISQRHCRVPRRISHVRRVGAGFRHGQQPAIALIAANSCIALADHDSTCVDAEARRPRCCSPRAAAAAAASARHLLMRARWRVDQAAGRRAHHRSNSGVQASAPSLPSM
jgi:hypothetical protein